MNHWSTRAACGGSLLIVLTAFAGCERQTRLRAEQAAVAAADASAKAAAEEASQRALRAEAAAVKPVDNDALALAPTEKSAESVAEKAATSQSETKSDPAADTEKSPTEQPTGGSFREITFDTLKFNHEKGSPFERKMIGEAIEKLSGKNIRIRGYMLPSFKQSGLTQFVLVRDNMQCCFGPGAALYDCIIVEMAKDKSTNFSIRPVAVEGTFTIHEVEGVEGNTIAVYHLDGLNVK